MQQLFQVAIIGRPNVGKSRFFNRLTGHNAAIVLPTAGTTRDRITGVVNWLDRSFILIDTGGITLENLPFQEAINLQANVAITTANLILFMVSYKDGLLEQDQFIFKTLKKLKNKTIFLVVNKSENLNQYFEIQQFQNFGFKNIFYISSEHGTGVGDLLDAIVKILNLLPQKKSIEYEFKMAIIGRTNVGKSTLVNSLIKENRLITSKIPHTTRDAIDIEIINNKKKYLLIDTAGIRASAKYHQIDAEKYSVLRTKKAIARANCLLLVLDLSEKFTQQDEIIAGLAYKANIPTIIVVNKWDELKEKSDSQRQIKLKEIKKQFQFIYWAPIIFISALKQQKLNNIFNALELITTELKFHFSTQILQDVLMKAQVLNPIPTVKNRKIKLNYIVQVEGQIPTFVIFCNNPELLHFSYARYIENQIRLAFGIKNIPITLFYKCKK